MGTRDEMITVIPYQDSRGLLKKVVRQSQLEGGGIEEVYLLYTLPGGVRGNHYHRNTLEYFTVVSGRALVALKDHAGGQIRQWSLCADDNQVIQVSPGMAHAFKNEGEEPLVILAVSSREYDPAAPDTFPCILLE